MNGDKTGTQTCYIHQCTNKGMLMYIACLNLVSVHFYAIPILHFKFPKLLVYTVLLYCVIFSILPNKSSACILSCLSTSFLLFLITYAYTCIS